MVKNPPVGDVRNALMHSPGREPWRRAWQPTPVFFPGEARGQRNLGDCSSIGLQSIRHDSIDLARMHAGRDEEAQCFRQKGIAGCVEGLEPLQRTGSNQGSWREGRGGGRVDKARKGGRTHFTGFVTGS